MISAEFRIRLPEGVWVAELSGRFPDATFRLLSGRRMSDAAIELGEIRTDEPDAVAASMRAHSAISEFELLEAADGRVLGKYETTDTGLYEFAGAASVPVEFPVVVRGGWYEFDLTGTRAELGELRATLEASGLAYELQSLVGQAETGGLLTDRQREVLAVAMREGYFEVPRECTLAELAETVGVDKSTASTVLRRGEATLVEWFLTAPLAEGCRDP